MKKLINFLILINITCFNVLHLEASSEIWFHSSGSYKSERYSENTQINEENISNLNIAWEHSTNQIREKTPIQSSPVYTGTKIVSLALNSIYALNPTNGELIWETFLDDHPFKLEGSAKGITFFNDINPKIYVPTNKGVAEINELNGKITNHFDTGASAMPPIIYEDNIIIATRWQGVKAYNRETKKILWHLETNKNGYQSHLRSHIKFYQLILLNKRF